LFVRFSTKELDELTRHAVAAIQRIGSGFSWDPSARDHLAHRRRPPGRRRCRPPLRPRVPRLIVPAATYL